MLKVCLTFQSKMNAIFDCSIKFSIATASISFQLCYYFGILTKLFNQYSSWWTTPFCKKLYSYNKTTVVFYPSFEYFIDCSMFVPFLRQILATAVTLKILPLRKYLSKWDFVNVTLLKRIMSKNCYISALFVV